MEKKPIILGIESSCDETAAAVIRENDKGTADLLSNIVSSQIDEHKKFGGVVPELAARAHLENIEYIINTALKNLTEKFPNFKANILAAVREEKFIFLKKEDKILQADKVYLVASSEQLNEILKAYGHEEKTAKKMREAILNAKKKGDSLGGIIESITTNVPVGLGEPIFSSLESDISKAIFSIPSVKGIEFGSGFRGSEMLGSENNDLYTMKKGKIVTKTNNSGGILGGISNGMPITMRIASVSYTHLTLPTILLV